MDIPSTSDHHIRPDPSHKALVAQTAIERLPDDVLRLIFWYIVPSPATYELRGTFLAFSQVSCRWRAVALDAASLWSQVVFQAPKLALIMLERARDTPLSIDIPLGTSLDGYKVALAKQQTIHSLSLAGSHTQLLEQLSSTSRPFPLLRSLSLSVSRSSHRADALRCPTLEDGSHSLLRHVELMRCTLPWGARCLSNLTTFKFITGRFSLDLQDILNVVARSPLLESLVLHDPLKSFSTPNTNGTRISLKKLRYLKLSDVHRHIRHLLDILIIPSSCRMSCTSSSRHMLGDYTQTILNRCVDRLESNGTTTDISHIRLSTKLARPRRFDLRFWKGRNDVVDDLPILRICFPIDGRASSSLFDCVFNGCLVMRLHSLTVDLDAETFSRCLQPHLATLSSVQSFIVHRRSFRPMLNALDGASETLGHPTPVTEFPALQTLRFKYLRMHDTEEEELFTDVECLARTLKRLKSVGIPLQQVILEKCVLEPGDRTVLDSLRREVCKISVV